jgi:hypothetical protein
MTIATQEILKDSHMLFRQAEQMDMEVKTFLHGVRAA